MAKIPELLAPAGNMDSLNAAVCAGADAIYLGAKSFSARANAGNFTIPELERAVQYCHLRNVKVYLTLNTLVITKEVSQAIQLIEDAYNCGVDAFIVQDLGIAKFISDNLGSQYLHFSTQMNIHNTQGVDAAEKLGSSRITLARELSLNEIRDICNLSHSKGINIECFVHGAICICYSGQCYMSSMIGARSANRGACAQPCRLEYDLINIENKKFEKNNKDRHILSPKDMCNISRIHELIEAGVDSFKVEGRMKSPEYVYSVIKTYRRIIDNSTLVQPKVSEQDIKDLSSTFSRGFSDAYLDGIDDMHLMNPGRPNNRGVLVGRVNYSSVEKIEIDSKENFLSGDVLNIWTKHGNVTHILKDSEIKQNRLVLDSKKDMRDVRKNDRVFRVRAKKDEFVPDMKRPKIEIDASLVLRVGKPIQVIIKNNNHVIKYQGEVTESAKTKPITKEDVIEHFGRLGNTDFELNKCDVVLDENVGIQFSKIHKLRGRVIDMLTREMYDDLKYNNKQNIKLQDKSFSLKNKKNKGLETQLCVIATNPDNARAALKSSIENVYVPYLNLFKDQATYEGKVLDSQQFFYPKNIIPILPRVNRQDFELENALLKYDRFMCEDIASLIELSSRASCEIGMFLPIVNDFSINFINEINPMCAWLSPELNLAQIKDIAQKIRCEVGIFAFGRQSLMLTQHCALNNLGNCNKNCKSCNRRKNLYCLHDRKGIDFPVLSDMFGKSTIYNSIDTDFAPYLHDLIEAGVARFMIDSTFMSKEKMLSMIDRFNNALIHPPKSRLQNTTSGHLFRGV